VVGTKRPNCSLLQSQNHGTINSKLAQDVFKRLHPYGYTKGELQRVMLNDYVMCILNETDVKFQTFDWLQSVMYRLNTVKKWRSWKHTVALWIGSRSQIDDLGGSDMVNSGLKTICVQLVDMFGIEKLYNT